MDRLLASSAELILRLSLLGGFALTPGPEPVGSTFPSTSSSGREDWAVLIFGSFEGCVGYGKAKKYGWFSAYRRERTA